MCRIRVEGRSGSNATDVSVGPVRAGGGSAFGSGWSGSADGAGGWIRHWSSPADDALTEGFEAADPDKDSRELE